MNDTLDSYQKCENNCGLWIHKNKKPFSTLYRGESGGRVLLYNEKTVGEVFQWNKLTSTSQHKDTIFINKGNPEVIWTIKNSKSGADINHLSHHSGGDMDQAEVLLPAGVKFKVTRVEERGSVTHIEVEEVVEGV